MTHAFPTRRSADLEPADDDREHIVEVVRDAAGELADRLHLLRLAQPRLGGLALGHFGAQRIVGTFKLGGARLDRNLQFGRAFAFGDLLRSEEHTSELQSLLRISYAAFCLKKTN